jgi:hypothetical protein
MSNPLTDVMPLLAFWRANWQSLVLGIVAFMGALALLFSVLVWIVLFLMDYRKHHQVWAAKRNTQQYFRENVTAPALAYLLLIPVFGSIYWPYHVYSNDQATAKTLQATLTKTEQQRDDAVSKSNELQATLERRRNIPDFNDPYFSNVIGGFRSFMTYRTAIGTGKCMFLITAPPDSADVERVMMYIGVYGANCPNGNLQNIGMTPEESEAAYLKGVPEGEVIFHAPSNWDGATALMDSLNDLVEMHRDYHLPRASPDNYIWFQIGHNVKFKSQKQ